VVGAPLVIVMFFVLTGTKELPYSAALFALVFLGLSYFVFPWLLIRFYNGQKIRQFFEIKDTKSYWIDNIPIQILVLSTLYLFYIIVLHILIMFKGIFPVFGIFF
jgi:hypothetical protein